MRHRVGPRALASPLTPPAPRRGGPAAHRTENLGSRTESVRMVRWLTPPPARTSNRAKRGKASAARLRQPVRLALQLGRVTRRVHLSDARRQRRPAKAVRRGREGGWRLRLRVGHWVTEPEGAAEAARKQARSQTCQYSKTPLHSAEIETPSRNSLLLVSRQLVFREAHQPSASDSAGLSGASGKVCAVRGVPGRPARISRLHAAAEVAYPPTTGL